MHTTFPLFDDPAPVAPDAEQAAAARTSAADVPPGADVTSGVAAPATLAGAHLDADWYAGEPPAEWLKAAFAACFEGKLKVLATLPATTREELGAALWAYALLRDERLLEHRSAEHAHACLHGHVVLNDAIERMSRLIIRQRVSLADIPHAHAFVSNELGELGSEHVSDSDQKRQRQAGS